MAERPEASDSQDLLSRTAAAIPPDKLTAAVASCQDAAGSPSRDTLPGMPALRLNETDPAAATAAIANIKDPALRPVLPAAVSR